MRKEGKDKASEKRKETQREVEKDSIHVYTHTQICKHTHMKVLIYIFTYTKYANTHIHTPQKLDTGIRIKKKIYKKRSLNHLE